MNFLTFFKRDIVFFFFFNFLPAFFRFFSSFYGIFHRLLSIKNKNINTRIFLFYAGCIFVALIYVSYVIVLQNYK